MQCFRFILDVWFDDVMISFVIDGGGVGLYFDLYDVFLLQVYGKCCWCIFVQDDFMFVFDLLFKILVNF